MVAFSWILFNCDKNATSPSSNNEDEPLNEGLIGEWLGTGFKFTNQNDSTQTINLILMGVSYSMTINQDSLYNSTTIFFGETLLETGSISTNGNQITITPNNADIRTGIYTLLDDSLAMVINDQEFDFNQDEIPEPAILSVELKKIE